MLKNMVLWGMGLPLGLAVWAGWALMAYEHAIASTSGRIFLPWVWMTFTFVYQSIQFVKTMRYLLPIYPTMALMAGYGLVWLWDARKQPACWPSWAALGAPAARLARWAVVVLLGTAFWALAFTGIYTRPCRASRPRAGSMPTYPRARRCLLRSGMIRCRSISTAISPVPSSARSRWISTGRTCPKSASSSMMARAGRLYRADQQPPVWLDPAAAYALPHDDALL